MAKETSLTPEGHDALVAELHSLENEKRAEIGERLRIAKEFGDISENSEYDDAKNEQEFVESRIAEIKQIIANATIIDAPKRSSKVNFGSTVTVSYDGKEETYTIVGAAEVNYFEGKISNESPVGSALIGAKKGDLVEVCGPTGVKTVFEVLKISNSSNKASK